MLATNPNRQRMAPDTRRRLLQADWADIGIRLTAYATWKARNFHWRTRRAFALAAGMTPEDIAREGIMKVLDGTRSWDPQRGPLLPFLHGVVDSLMSHLATSADNTQVELLGDNEPNWAAPNAAEPTVSEDVVDRLRDLLHQHSQHDLLAVLDAVQRCAPKPQAIALQLGITVPEVNNRLKRLRRLALKALRGAVEEV